MLKNARTIVVLLAAATLYGCKSALFGSIALVGSHSAQVTSGIVFDTEHALKLDVYRPANVTSAPVIVFFYGGSWQSGERAWYRYAGEALAKEGFVVVIPDYRKYPQVQFPTFVDDAANAVAWTRANAATYGGDPQHLFVMGHSSGAHIGALLVTDARYLAKVQMKPRDVSGFIGLAGPYDFAPFRDPELVAIFGSGSVKQSAAMPGSYIDGDEPPMLLLQGAADTTVDPSNTRKLTAALQAQNEPVETKFYPGVGHAKIALSLSPLLRSSTTALADTADFIHRHSQSSASAN